MRCRQQGSSTAPCYPIFLFHVSNILPSAEAFRADFDIRLECMNDGWSYGNYPRTQPSPRYLDGKNG